jgi:hypothetical protein
MSLKRNFIIELLAILLVFTFLSIILTNGVLLDIDKKIFTGGVGDATSGFLWLLYANDGASLWGGTTNLINFPYGEQLGSPVYVTWLLVLGPLWLLSLVLSPIAALNVMMVIGFVTAGVASYYLIKRVIKSRFISFIGAYAITFAPYHILKAPDHLTNIFVWPLVGIVGFFVAFWRKQTLARGFGLALFLAAAIYTDGYYIFIAGILFAALLIGLVFTDFIYRQKLKKIALKVGKLALVGVVAVILLLPILLVQLSAGSEVSKDLANSRGNIKGEVRYYASKPIDFLLPPQANVTVENLDWYRDLVTQKNSRSNMGENTTYIGYVVLTLFLIGAFFSVRKAYLIIRDKRKKVAYPSLQNHMLTVSVIAVPLILLWMLPPTIHLLGIEIRTPIDLLTSYVALWRVPSRLFIALHILLVVAAMITLYKLTKNLKGWKRWLVLSLILLLVVVESYSNIKRPSFGLDNMPKTYSWLKTQNDVHAIAELPLLDWPVEVSGYYVFGQLIHNKPMVNTALARKDSGLFNPLGNLLNPETINFLKSRGVDTVLVHSRSCDSNEWGVLIHTERVKYSPEYIDKKATMLCTYKLNSATDVDPLFVYLNKGFVKQNYLDEDGRYWNPLDSSYAEIGIVDNKGIPITKNESALLEFDTGVLGEYPKKDYKVVLRQNGNLLGEYYTSKSSSVSVNIDSTMPIRLEVKTMDGFEVSPGEFGLTSVQVTTAR